MKGPGKEYKCKGYCDIGILTKDPKKIHSCPHECTLKTTREENEIQLFCDQDSLCVWEKIS